MRSFPTITPPIISKTILKSCHPPTRSTLQYQGTSWGLRASAAAALALLLALLPMDAAEAARSGGRMGGSSRGFAAQPPPRAAVPRGGTARGSAGPRISIGMPGGIATQV
jgi:uncharacterized membrane protein